jgi:hypothetical protein
VSRGPSRAQPGLWIVVRPVVPQIDRASEKRILRTALPHHKSELAWSHRPEAWARRFAQLSELVGRESASQHALG